MYMPTKKLRRGLRHSKKLRGGSFFGLFGPSTPTAPEVKPTNQTNPTIEQLNAKINDILQRLSKLEAKLP